MRFLKDTLLLAKYPCWNSKMINRISFYSFLFLLILWMSFGFLKADLEKRYEAMPENTFINGISQEENFKNITNYTEVLQDKGALLGNTLNTEIQVGYSFITSSYTRKEKDSRTTMYRYIFSTDPVAYIQTINNQALEVPFFDRNIPGVLISDVLALEWFGTTNITKKVIYLTTSTFGEINLEAPILGVFHVKNCKSILFDASSDQANSLDDTILATMSLADQLESIIPIGEIALNDMYKLSQPITSKEYNSIVQIFPKIQCRYYAINQYFLMVEPLFTLIFIILISFFIVSTLLLIFINILRFIDIRPIIEIEKIYYMKKTTLIGKIFLSSIIKTIRDFLVLCFIYLMVNGVLYLSIGYFISIELSIGIMLAIMLGTPILVNSIGAVYFSNRRLSPR